MNFWLFSPSWRMRKEYSRIRLQNETWGEGGEKGPDSPGVPGVGKTLSAKADGRGKRGKACKLGHRCSEAQQLSEGGCQMGQLSAQWCESPTVGFWLTREEVFSGEEERRRGREGIFQALCFTFHWSLVALQSCVSFCCAVKWASYTYTSTPSFLDFLPI